MHMFSNELAQCSVAELPLLETIENAGILYSHRLDLSKLIGNVIDLTFFVFGKVHYHCIETFSRIQPTWKFLLIIKKVSYLTWAQIPG